MTKAGEALAALMDETADEVLHGSSNAYEASTSQEGPMADLISFGPEAHSTGRALSLWAQIADLYSDPRGPLSMELTEIVARRFATEWLAIPDRASEDAQDQFLGHWWARIDKIVAECTETI